MAGSRSGRRQRVAGESTPYLLRSHFSPPAYLIPRVNLEFDLDARATRVTSTLDFASNGADGEPLFLDGEDLELLAITLNGKRLSADRCQMSSKGLAIHDPGHRGRLRIVTEVRPRVMEGLVLLDETLITHCEPTGFRRLTYFPDRPDVLSIYACTLTADREHFPVLLANGHCHARKRLPNGRHSATWLDPHPKASYLFALVAGKLDCVFDRFTTASGRDVSLNVYAGRDDLPFCAHGLQALKRAMAWDEKAYGREYDLDVLNIAVVRSYPGGAMENKGLNLYASEFFLASAEISTDEQLAKVEATVAHEYFHNWTGNRVGCQSWFELSLKEGLTVFRQQQYMESILGKSAARIDDIARLREVQFPEEEGELAVAVRPEAILSVNNLYTRTVYEKGAELIRMMQALIGDAGFMAAMRAFFERFDGKPATIDDLLDTVEEVTSTDLAGFRPWYSAIGPLWLRVVGRRRRKELILELEQSGTQQPLRVPVAISLCSKSRPLETARSSARMVTLTEQRARVVFDDVPADATYAISPAMPAPVRWRAPRPARDLASIALCHPDPVFRWDAAQSLARRAILEGSAGARAAWLDVAADAVGRRGDDPGIVARIMCLPTEAQLASGQDRIDVDGLIAARNALAMDTGISLQKPLHALCARVPDGDSKKEGARRLRNLCLWYLLQAGHPAALELCQRQLCSPLFDSAFAALKLLVDVGGEPRSWALERSWAWWRGNAICVDHWFAAQAASRARDCPQQVQGLTAHEAFSLDNATRLKALFDTFTGNLAAFHHRSHLGYEIVLNTVVALNATNPRLAARFLRRFDNWRKLDASRARAVRRRLESLRRVPDLAPDLLDIAVRSLDGLVETVGNGVMAS